jgi:hypothetical protein
MLNFFVYFVMFFWASRKHFSVVVKITAVISEG